MAQTLDTALGSDPELDDAEAHVGRNLLASHEPRLAAERAALEAKNVPAEDGDLLVVVAGEHDVRLLTTREGLDEFLEFVRVRVGGAIAGVVQAHQNVLAHLDVRFPLTEERDVLVAVREFLASNEASVVLLLEPLIVVAVDEVEVHPIGGAGEQLGSVLQLGGCPNLSQFVDVAGTTAHALEVQFCYSTYVGLGHFCLSLQVSQQFRLYLHVMLAFTICYFRVTGVAQGQ